MSSTKMDQLKELVATAEELSTALNFFFDHFGEDPSFLARGKTTDRAPVLTSLLQMSTQPLFGKKPRVSSARWVHLKKERLAHGACMLEGRMAMVVYLTDRKVGIVSVHDPATGGSQMVRFTHSSLAPDGGKEPEIDDPNERLDAAEPVQLPPGSSSDSVS